MLACIFLSFVHKLKKFLTHTVTFADKLHFHITCGGDITFSLKKIIFKKPHNSVDFFLSVEATQNKYLEAYRILTGSELAL